MIVAGTGLVAGAATGLAVRSRAHKGFNAGLVTGSDEFDRLVNETLERVEGVE